jgi:hypothetical protein
MKKISVRQANMGSLFSCFGHPLKIHFLSVSKKIAPTLGNFAAFFLVLRIERNKILVAHV